MTINPTQPPTLPSEEAIREAIKKEYGNTARRARERSAGCCGSTSTATSQLYTADEVAALPPAAMLASRGCGNPTALADLRPGEVVLDLGSGGGIDVLLSARRVGPTGKAYGLDMTDEMLALAEENKRKAGVANVEFLKGEMEAIPLPDESVDVVISNCVINLSTDKDRVLREAFRVLRPGGRFAVSDIVIQGDPLPPAIRQQVALWTGCIAGALTERAYLDKLTAAGFRTASVEVTHVYTVEDVPAELRCGLPDDLNLPPNTRVVSAFIRATK